MAHEMNFYNEKNGGKDTPKGLVSVEADKAVAEIQSAMVIAKKFPRDERAALDRILTACSRPTLAETSQYQYAKGGTSISGASIRLAEALAQSWGNLQFGIKELSQEDGSSTVQSYAWDIENNTRREMVFQVSHIRHTRQGDYMLTDPREIYELVANQGARRLRACILALIPGDVQDAAIAQCNTTLNASCDMSPDAINKMVSGFAAMGVSKTAIEKRLQRRLDTITPAQMINIKNVYNSIRDGMSSPNDWFESDSSSSENPEALDKALTAIEKAGSKAEIDIVLSLIDGLAAADQKIARAKWMAKVEDLKKTKAGAKKVEPKPKETKETKAKTAEKEPDPDSERNWQVEIDACRSRDDLNRLLNEVPEGVYMDLNDFINDKLDSFRD